jgi:hypothetical protein
VDILAEATAALPAEDIPAVATADHQAVVMLLFHLSSLPQFLLMALLPKL